MTWEYIDGMRNDINESYKNHTCQVSEGNMPRFWAKDIDDTIQMMNLNGVN